MDRTGKIRSKKRSKREIEDRPKSDASPEEDHRSAAAGHLLDEELVAIANVVETRASASKTSSSRFEELEEKRRAAILFRELAREEHARVLSDAAGELERKRHENVQMKREDDLASALERLMRKKQRLKSLKIRLERISSTPIFTCIQALSEKKLRITIYEQRARGYMLDGLRIVAYDPTSSSSFPLLMTSREYMSLGYGRTHEGLGAFCKWLCLLYEKRKRHFRLIWSGPPCPPPLRIREYDSVLCIHKEGLKLMARSPGFFLVAVFVRPSECTKLHFVMSQLKDTNSTNREEAVHAQRLVHPGALRIHCGKQNDSYVVWKHQQPDDVERGNQSVICGRKMPPAGNRKGEIRVYSGEIRMLNLPILVHVFDVTPTEYALELHLPSNSTLPPELRKLASKRVTLLKHDVNPYDVRLPLSAFGDLLASITFSPPSGSDAAICNDADQGASIAEWNPIVSSKWMEKLAKYVRVLRMARFGYRVDRKYYFATLSVVQQKTEFRAYLLLELTCISDLSMKKQPLRISLSHYLRCGNAMNHILPLDEKEGDEGCQVCSKYALLPNAPTTYASSNTCSSCDGIQSARLAGVRELVVNGRLSPEAGQIDYHGHCRFCGAVAKPMLLILSTLTSAAGVLQLLGYHFSCFDMGTLHSASESCGTIGDDLRQAIEVERIVAGYNADCGTTVAAASEFTNELHRSIYPEHHELPFHVVFVVDSNSLSHDQWENSSAHHTSRDQDVVGAFGALSSAASRIGEQEAVSMAGGHQEEEGALDFEAYLVSEALLVEATRVLLQPEVPWRKPGETVGASSWSTACEFLQDPRALSSKLLRDIHLSSIPPATQEVLDAYFSHPKWPHTYEEVRRSFHGLLCYMLHLSHVQDIVRGRGGLLRDGTTNPHCDESGSHESDTYAKHTSVLSIVQQSL